MTVPDLTICDNGQPACRGCIADGSCALREECDRCPEQVNPDARCTHGRDLCPEHLTACRECRDEFADDGRLAR